MDAQIFSQWVPDRVLGVWDLISCIRENHGLSSNNFCLSLPMKLDERFCYSRGVEIANFRVDTCPGTSELPLDTCPKKALLVPKNR